MDQKEIKLAETTPEYAQLLKQEEELMTKGRNEKNDKKADAIMDELATVRQKIVKLENIVGLRL